MLTENFLNISKAWFFDYDTYLDTSSLTGFFGYKNLLGGTQRTYGIYPPSFAFGQDLVAVNARGEGADAIRPYFQDGTRYIRYATDYSISMLVFGESGVPPQITDYCLGSILTADELCICSFEPLESRVIEHGYQRGCLRVKYRMYLKNCSGRTLHLQELGLYTPIVAGNTSSLYTMMYRETFPEITVPPDAMVKFDYSIVF